MPTPKMHVKGTSLDWDKLGGTAWATLVDLVSGMPPHLKTGTAETTILDPGEDHRTHIPGWQDGDEMKLKFRLHKTQFLALQAAQRSQTPAAIPNWKFKFPMQPGETTALNCITQGIITEVSGSEATVDGDKVYDCDLNLKLTGGQVWAGGT